MAYAAARVWLLAIGLALLAGPAVAAKRVALVIGNDGYRNVPALQRGKSDAAAVAAALEGLGFQVRRAEDLTQRAMSEALLRFDGDVGPGDAALFFFAGHGFEIRGVNYLLPVDVPAASEGEEELIRDASFAVDRIVERLQARGARTAIMVLDACRNNPFERPGKRSLGGSAGLAPMASLPEGVFLMYSAGFKQSALDRLSDDDRDPNSVFTRHFLREIATPDLTLVQVAKRVQASVKRLAATARHEQTPAYYDQIVGDVVLNGAGTDAPSRVPVAPVAMLPVPPPRLAPPPPTSEPSNGPIADFMRHNGGWSVSLSFPDAVTAISWRLGDRGEFRETGFLDVLDPRTRRRMPNPSIGLPPDAPAGTIEVRAIDARGDPVGPFPIRFDPTAALERSQRKILEMTAGSWLSFREFNGLLLYTTHLMSYRCAIREARIGVDSAVPDRKLPMPPCDPKEPSAIPSDVLPYLKLPPATKAVSLEITYRDGSQSEVKTFRR